MTNIQRIMVAGGGTMGSQVAWMAAWHGKEVAVYDAFEQGLDTGRKFHEQFAQEFLDKRGASQEEVDATKGRLSYTTDLETAVNGAQLIIEQVPENLEIKNEFWSKASAMASDSTIFCTNTSSLPPSQIAPAVNDPTRFTTLHFCVVVWESNLGEVMRLPQTSDDTFNTTIEFAQEMGLVPIVIEKEQPGYVLNSIMIPFCLSGLELVRTGVATPADVDRTWMIGLQTNLGPLGMVDKMGMNVAYNVCMSLTENGVQDLSAVAEWIKADYIDKGNLGRGTGKGFYTYPNPEFERDDFTSAKD